MPLPLIPLALGLAGGLVYEKNETKIKSKLHALKDKVLPSKAAVPPTLIPAASKPLSQGTQEWLQAQTPQDQALFGQMMATGLVTPGANSNPHNVMAGQYIDPSMYGYGGYPDPSQYGYGYGYDPSSMYGYGGYADPSQMYGGYPPYGYDPSQMYGQQYGQQAQQCGPGQRLNPSTGQCETAPSRARRGSQQQKHIVSSKCVAMTMQQGSTPGQCIKTAHTWSDGSVTYS